MQQPNEETLRRRLAEHSPRTIWLERERPMAVLLPLIEGPEGWQVLFEVRAAGISQPGEVCFPGGRVEPGETPEEAAARECREELCLAPKQVELLGAGDRIATPGGVLVHSFAGVHRRLFQKRGGPGVYGAAGLAETPTAAGAGCTGGDRPGGRFPL